MKATISVTATALIILTAVTAMAAGTNVEKCLQAKLKAFGKQQACLKKNQAGVIAGKDDASADCSSKFADAIQKIDTKAALVFPIGSCRDLDNGNGSFTDLNTGLTWEAKTGDDGVANLGSVHDADNTYQWSSTGSAADGGAFTNFLSTLNGATTGICFASHCDWRLATAPEMIGLLGTGSTVEPEAEGLHWSGISKANPVNADGFDTALLATIFDLKTQYHYVRAVRSSGL